MKQRVRAEIDTVAEQVGAEGWEIIREGKHLIVDFKFGNRIIRQVMAATPSGPRARQNEAAWLRRQVRT
jgi:hypothetical protein